MSDIAALIEREYFDALGRPHTVADATVARLVTALERSRGSNGGAMLATGAATCFLPDWDRGWGIAAQLYGLRSPRNWGIGDFTDLKRLVELAGAAGADFVGVNPLHALYAADPARISPYSPSSREFLNVLYIDPAAMIGFADAPILPAMIGTAEFHNLLEQQRNNATVDYVQVASMKHGIFRGVFDAFETRLRDNPRDAAVRDFLTFVNNRGEPLRRFAAYQALSSREGFGANWQTWPEQFRDPAGQAAADFAEQNARELRYHSFLQWQASLQLRACAEAGRAAGMRIGLYLDLALGCSPDSAEGWAEQGRIIDGFYIGAPPDPWNATGQDWGLGAYNPEALIRAGGAVLRRIIAATMAHAGAMRIDHVLGFNRLFLVPVGGKPAEGVYLRMPFDALSAAVAAESAGRHCMVVGEDLGAVPPDLPPRLHARGILSYRLLIFMRKNGRYLSPDAYPREALAALSTHDLPTWNGFWEGHDIALKYGCGIYEPGVDERQAHDTRQAECRAIRDAFAQIGPDPGGDPAALAVAVHRFLAMTPSRLAVVQLEDLAQEKSQANLPGAPFAAYPSFARKLEVGLDTIFADNTARAILAAMRTARPRGDGG